MLDRIQSTKQIIKDIQISLVQEPEDFRYVERATKEIAQRYYFPLFIMTKFHRQKNCLNFFNSLMHIFNIAKASVPGSIHYNNFKNNKENLILEKKEDYIIGIITSGADTGSNNEACAQLCSGIAKENIVKMVEKGKDWKVIQDEIHLFFQELFKDENFSVGQKVEKDFIKNYCLFTLMGFVIHKDELTVFHTGDGLIQINDELIVDQNTNSNYLFIDDYSKQKHLVYQSILLSSLKNLIIATRGIYGLMNRSSILSYLFQKVYHEDFQLKEYLTEEMQKGNLMDDTSLIMLKRKS
jgi:hypothetical protein